LTILSESGKLVLIDLGDTIINQEGELWMDHKNPVSGIGDGVLFWDILKPAICAGCRLWQGICIRESVKFGENLEHIINFAGLRIISMYQRCWHSRISCEKPIQEHLKHPFLDPSCQIIYVLYNALKSHLI
jgi:hypothetical protein